MKHQLKLWLVIYLAMLSTSAVMAQQPGSGSEITIRPGNNSNILQRLIPKTKKERTYQPDSTHSPDLAVLHSLMLPGWGQLYNHRWWKVPVIYGGLSLLGVAIVYNNTHYNEFLALSKYRKYGTAPLLADKYYAQAMYYSKQPRQALYDETDLYRRERDLCILGMAGAWAINVIDAYIDAKFIRSYSVDDDLSMQIAPDVINGTLLAQNLSASYIPAIKVTFTF